MNFIPQASHYTTILSNFLKKNPPQWNTSYSEAVAHLKRISQKPPHLHIPSSGQLILQTDVSDHFWGAILIEEIKRNRHYCGHGNGQFKDAQKHYHTVYKEILAVKNGISKFDFHPRTRSFVIEMDNSSFLKVLEFRNKLPSNPQLLRLNDWFSRYGFSVKHIKGHNNIILDMLSRPHPITLISQTGSIPLLYMITSSASSLASSPSILHPPHFPPELMVTIPPGQSPSVM
ncbi:hypothetical protein Ddye_029687 [Dipteronia dyeriana]|uniref:Reverse transcriptase/retrotransposon-derived protein RNase H-like domain-containing protein n=1 Tax=Dipteronia dyeriana TaxID=168575 RepID=A0AAD9TEW6_9ROSI|nr:hypothetical protein Ddye_029687 [Dipteronia dyeriana]